MCSQRSAVACGALISVTLPALIQPHRRTGQKQARLRAAHLKYHLSTVATLGADQVKHCNILRGDGGHDSHGAKKPE